MSEEMQLSNHQKSLMISLGHYSPPVTKEHAEPEQTEQGKAKRKPFERRTLSMREPDIKWREIRRWIKKYLLDVGYESSDYKDLYRIAKEAGLDLECWPGKIVGLRSFANQALKVRLELGLPSIRRIGVKEKILEKFNAGFSEKAIAKLLDCNYSHVYNTLIIAGKIKKRTPNVY